MDENENLDQEIKEETTEEVQQESEEETTSQKETKKGFGVGKKKASENKEVKKLKEELEETQSRYMRMAAEYDNYKKRTAREMDARYNDAKLDILKAILPVLDNFERGMEAECTDSAYKQGVELIFKQFTDLLTQYGVEEIPALGQSFDPNFHNAVMHIDDENLGENEIAEVFQKGYKQGDKVLRHSMVKVAN